MRVSFFKRSLITTVLLIFVLYLTACQCVMADTEDVIDRSFEVSKGGTLTMDVNLGSIRVETSDADVVKIKVIRKVRTSNEEKAREAFDEYEVEFEHSGSNVTVESDYDGSRGLFSWLKGKNLSVRFLVTVPSTYNLDLETSGGSISVDDIEGKIKAQTSGGSLKFARVKGPVWGKTSGGSITLDGCTGDAEVKTSGGSIRIGKVEGEVNAHTSGGSITVQEVMGTINASTSGGSITASISKQPEGNCKLKTSGGSVTVSLAGDIKVDLDAQTSGGRVYTDFPVTVRGELSKRRLKAQINGGGPELYLRTSGGSIKINKD